MDLIQFPGNTGYVAQTQTAKHRGRPPKEESFARKEAVIAAALKLFSERGFLDTSFAMIAAEIGISQPAIHHYFANKEELILAVIQEITQQNRAGIEAKFKAEDDALTALKKHSQGNLEWAIKNPSQAQVVILLYYYAIADDYFSKLYDQMQSKGQERVYTLLYAGQREGMWTYSQLELKELSFLLHSHLMGLIINVMSSQRSRGPQVKKYFDEQWDFLIDTLLTKKKK